MGHYDNCRDGYCGKCGAAPGNITNGVCEFCGPKEASRPTAKDAVEALVTNARVAAEQTFVFENVEVKKTGRKASHKLRSGKTDEVVEVTPVDATSGSWKKWVREDTLFRVEQ